MQLFTLTHLFIFILTIFPIISHANVVNYYDNKMVPNESTDFTKSVSDFGGFAGVGDLSLSIISFAEKPIVNGKVLIKLGEIKPGSDLYTQLSSAQIYYDKIIKDSELDRLVSDGSYDSNLRDSFKAADAQRTVIGLIHEEAARLQSAKGFMFMKDGKIGYDIQKEAFTIHLNDSNVCTKIVLRAKEIPIKMCIEGSIQNANKNHFYSLKFPAQKARKYFENNQEGRLRLFLGCEYKNLVLYPNLRGRNQNFFGECATTKAILAFRSDNELKNPNEYEVVATYEAIPTGVLKATKAVVINKVPELKNGPAVKLNSTKQQTIKINQ